jgi:hypothetical protein
VSRVRSIRLIVVVVAATLALLASAVPAQAAYTTVPFCGSLRPSGGWDPKTLHPGDVCTFPPVAVQSMHIWWTVTQAGGPGGAILLGVVQSPPGYPGGQVLGPAGGPGPWSGGNPTDGGAWWFANNGFNAVYGQPVVLNYSNYTIKLWPNNGSLGYYY